MTVLQCVDVGLSPEKTDNPRLTNTSGEANGPIPGARSPLTAWLERLAALARPLMGRSGGADRPPRPTDPQADAKWRQAQQLALAGRLATGLIHDFNNALLVAVASLDLIAETPDDAALVQDQAQAASSALRRASDAARRLMTLGRPDDACQRQVDLGEIVRATVKLAEPLTRPCIDLSVSCPAHALPVHVNRAQIEQAILNLCLNARDAMPDGGIAAHHDAVGDPLDPSRGGWPRASAGDLCGGGSVGYGPGHPAAPSGSGVEPFFTTKAPGQGSGLGLSMVRDTTTAHDGLVELTSDPLGTTVRILLPLC